jgi:hypothetical protein
MWGKQDTFPVIFKLDTRYIREVEFARDYGGEKAARYPLYRIMGGLQGRREHV